MGMRNKRGPCINLRDQTRGGANPWLCTRMAAQARGTVLLPFPSSLGDTAPARAQVSVLQWDGLGLPQALVPCPCLSQKNFAFPTFSSDGQFSGFNLTSLGAILGNFINIIGGDFFFFSFPFFSLNTHGFKQKIPAQAASLAAPGGQTEAVLWLCHALEKSQGQDQNCWEMKAKWEASVARFPRPASGGSGERK